MRKEDLYISVPVYFKCPISLDVMQSPVSLSTGVSYDRASIQRWLDGGNNTCPATMQVLQSKEIVPNRTLQRLIKEWSDTVRRTADPPESAAPSREEVSDALEKMNLDGEESERVELMTNIVRFATESEENRRFLAGKPDLLLMLSNIMTGVDSRTGSSSRLQELQLAVKILSSIRSKIVDRERLSNLVLNGGRDCLTAIVLVIQRGNVESKIGSLNVLESIAIDNETKILIAERDGLTAELINSINRDSDRGLIEASLSCLIAISTAKQVKLKLIRAKLVTHLTNLLSDPSNPSVSATEKSLKLLEIMSSCKEGREEICGDGGACVRAVVLKAMKVSTAATEHAVTVLWSVCYLLKDERAMEAVTTSNGVTKILLLLQSNCSAAVRQMLRDLLKVFSASSGSCLPGYDTKTTHIMPF